MSRSEAVQVQCYSGHTYAERPDSFTWEEAKHQVKEVEREWRVPGKKHFLVRTEDNRLFELCYKEQEDEWTLIEKVE